GQQQCLQTSGRGAARCRYHTVLRPPKISLAAASRPWSRTLGGRFLRLAIEQRRRAVAEAAFSPCAITRISAYGAAAGVAPSNMDAVLETATHPRALFGRSSHRSTLPPLKHQLRLFCKSSSALLRRS